MIAQNCEQNCARSAPEVRAHLRHVGEVAQQLEALGLDAERGLGGAHQLDDEVELQRHMEEVRGMWRWLWSRGWWWW